jgi:hypothetical protein
LFQLKYAPNEAQFFSLKGWDNIAQGNALGRRSNNHMHPEGVRPLAFVGGLMSQPFRLDYQTVIRPRALPWTMLSQPFRLKNVSPQRAFQQSMFSVQLKTSNYLTVVSMSSLNTEN